MTIMLYREARFIVIMEPNTKCRRMLRGMVAAADDEWSVADNTIYVNVVVDIEFHIVIGLI